MFVLHTCVCERVCVYVLPPLYHIHHFILTLILKSLVR